MLTDIPQTERYMAVSTVHILMERFPHEEPTILAVFASADAAEKAQATYQGKVGRNSKYSYDYEIWEVLDQTTISKSEGAQTPAVGEGFDPDNLSDVGAG